MNNLQLTELTEEEMVSVDGGQVDGLACAGAGFLLVAGFGTGNLFAGGGALLFLYVNRDKCLSL